MFDEPAPSASQTLDAILAEQRRAWLAGQRTPAEEWLKKHADLAESACAIEVVYQEYLLRQELDDNPDWDDYLRRFPHFAHALQALHEADALVSEVLAPGAPPRRSAGRFGRYDLLAKVGEGGMGVVYKAQQDGLGRVVALKMLRGGEYADEKERHRFLREARAVASLQHPNIVALYEVGEVDDLPFLSLEFVEGRSLAQCLDGTPWVPRSAARLVEVLARAVAYAHGRGIVHRDLKPSNVLVAGTVTTPPEHGTPKITDFGLAKRLDGASQSRSGHLVGTPSYMAPEAADPRLGAIGPATDVYGLGAVLYELLTGRPPFRADSLLETLRQVVLAEPAPPRVLNPAVPHDLETICLTCLHKEPAGRYHSAEALADDLRHFIQGEPVSARPVGRVSRLWRWSRRNRALAGALAAVLLAVAAGLAGVLYEWHQTNLEWHRAEAARQAAEASDAEAFQIFSELTQNTPGWPVDGPEGGLEVHRLTDLSPDGPTPYSQLELSEVQRALAPLEKADAHGARLLQRNPQNLALRRALTSVRISCGTLSFQQGNVDRAAQCYASACDLWVALVQEDPTNREYRNYLATTEFCRSHAHVGNYAQAFEAIEEAQRLWHELADEEPTNLAWLSRLAFCRRVVLDPIGGSISSASQAVGSLEAHRVRLDNRLRAEPNNVPLRRRLAFTCLVLATIRDHDFSPQLAMPLWKQARNHFRVLAARPQADLMTRFNLACCDARLMRSTAGDPHYVEALRLFTQIHDRLIRHASVVAQDWCLLCLQRQTHEALAFCCWKAGNDAEAEKWVRRLMSLPTKRERTASAQRPSLKWILELTSTAAAFCSTRPSAALAMTRQAAALVHQYDADAIPDRRLRAQAGSIYA